MLVAVETSNGTIEVEVRAHVFSPCVDILGYEYALVLYAGRHPMMPDAPVRAYATAVSVDLAHADARRSFAHAYRRVTKQAGRRMQANALSQTDTAV